MNGDVATWFNGEVTLSCGQIAVNPTKVVLTNGEVTLNNITLYDCSENARLHAQSSSMIGDSNFFTVRAAECSDGTFTGRVLDISRLLLPVNGATVYLALQPYGSPLYPGQPTNSEGSYSFTVPPGRYYLWAIYNGRKSMESPPISVIPSKSNNARNLVIGFQETRRPVIFVPGIMGSTKAELGGQGYPTLPEDIAPNQGLLELYNPFGIIADHVGWELLETLLEDEGYSVYRAPYDWRVSLNDAEKTYWKYLISKIDQAKDDNPGFDKVDIVAHSMGGLLVRNYIQSDEYRGDIDKFAIVGTPNKGSLSPYYIWEGGDPIMADAEAGNIEGSILPLFDKSYFYSHVADNLYKAIKKEPLLTYECYSQVSSDSSCPMEILKMRIDYSAAREFIRQNCPSLQYIMAIFANPFSGVVTL
jgi:pimeloyl-ACP methyl ester carboxylesterase